MLKLLDKNKGFIRSITDQDYKDLRIESELSNGDRTLFFTFRGKPADIRPEGYIETEDDLFVIKEVQSGTYAETEVVGKLDLEELEANPFTQFTAKDSTCLAVARLALAGSGWTAQSTITKIRSVQQIRKTPLEVLYAIRDAFMCEISFDTKNRIVSLVERIGEDRGVYFRSELNLKSIDCEEESHDFYTRIIPLGKDGLTIKSVNGGIEYLSNYQYSTKIRTLIWEDTSYENAADLKTDAQQKLNDISRPKVSYSARVRDLAGCARDGEFDQKLSYRLGDTIHLTDEPSGIMDKQRIVKIVEYPNDPESNTVELSNTILSWEEMQKRLEDAAAAWETISNTDGTVNGVYVHGVQAGDIVGIEVVVNDEIDTNETVAGISALANALDTRVGTIETNYLSAETAQLNYATISSLDAVSADVGSLSASYAAFSSTVTDELAAHDAVIGSLSATYATISSLNAISANLNTLSGNYAQFNTAVTNELNAVSASLSTLSGNYAQFSTTVTNELEAHDAVIDSLSSTYATIDLANIAAGSIKTAMIDTGAVGTAQIADGSITDAKIVGLTASKITAGTLNAGVIDVVNLNASNITVGTLNGQRIANGAINADKLSEELSDTIDSAVANAQVFYALGTSPSQAPSSGWSESAPEWEDGKYMWQQTVLTLSDGTVVTKPAICISGATGAPGEDAALLRIDSSRGNVFKNNAVSTVLTVAIYKGEARITNKSALTASFGAGAYLQWYWQRMGENVFHEIISSDSKLSDEGFTLTLTPEEVDTKVTFMCQLVIS